VSGLWPMSEPRFFTPPRPLSLDEVASLTGSAIAARGRSDLAVTGIAPLERAGPADAGVLDAASSSAAATALSTTQAGMCFLREDEIRPAPEGLAILIAAEPHAALARLALALFPEAARPRSTFDGIGTIAASATVHATARLEANVSIDPGVVVGAGAEIGAGTVVGANTVIGPEVRIGRSCEIGPNASIMHALLGDRVVIEAGARLGQEGATATGSIRPPSLGRVIVQDGVRIGAGTVIDRGVERDTVVGEGTQIDGQVRVGRDATVGRHCSIAAQSGIANRAKLGDGITFGSSGPIV
jgi:UDP-3-O-[3-hydroxymyristoyl] glucosamine N-acyltransferase